MQSPEFDHDLYENQPTDDLVDREKLARALMSKFGPTGDHEEDRLRILSYMVLLGRDITDGMEIAAAQEDLRRLQNLANNTRRIINERKQRS